MFASVLAELVAVAAAAFLGVIGYLIRELLANVKEIRKAVEESSNRLVKIETRCEMRRENCELHGLRD